jgi:hypothetical protein
MRKWVPSVRFGDVNHLRLEAGDLHLDSTATRHTAAGVPLWLRGPMYQGTLTGCPS